MLCYLGLGGQEVIFIFLLLGLTIVPQIIAIVHIVRSTLENTLKLIWVLVTLFIPLGWLVYFLAGRPKE
ncbi:PLDc N-terminal domain-containing protein [Runella salmonicolor]|uniref:PLDc N-terminal domain-containing protein n=1 Tax=Runella salmonicolor TaxID=2950278 RepID=A0ABT1FR24_9BACT|nr:PLDc N-terminal domain-containing protein [Runella salmonicolor]MCP1384225.1 PLDc N-terminal domain-containing protein [Runella salmonicolor]